MSYYYKRLRELREDNDLKQREIADYLNIRQEYYSKYELGKIEIPAHMIKQLAIKYKVSADYILELTKDPTTNWVEQSNKIPPVIKNNIQIGTNTGNIKINQKWG